MAFLCCAPSFEYEAQKNTARLFRLHSWCSQSVQPPAPLFELSFRTLQTQILPAGGRMCPARPREQPIVPPLEGSRRRIRLLRVHSHSHGKQPFGAGKRGARSKNTRGQMAQVVSVAVLLWRVCRLHGAVLLPCSGFCSPESMFLPSYQNFCPFSSEITPDHALFSPFSRAARGFFPKLHL